MIPLQRGIFLALTNKLLPYNPDLKLLAGVLRKNSTLSEVLLWKEIKSKNLGIEFHRQVPIDNYIVDFFCHEFLLAIEVDGSSHDSPNQFKSDRERQDKLEMLGVNFIRIDDLEIKTNLDGVMNYLKIKIQDILDEK